MAGTTVLMAPWVRDWVPARHVVSERFAGAYYGLFAAAAYVGGRFIRWREPVGCVVLAAGSVLLDGLYLA